MQWGNDQARFTRGSVNVWHLRLTYHMTIGCLVAMLSGMAWSSPCLSWAASPSTMSSSASEPVYSMATVLDLALARNPTVASAEGTIEQNRGQQVAAHTYLNPSVNANSGRGRMRDLGHPGGKGQTVEKQGYRYEMFGAVGIPALDSRFHELVDVLGLAFFFAV